MTAIGLSVWLWASGPLEVTPESERSSARAIQFLVTAQNADGSWGIEPRMPGDVGTTAMVLLSFLAAGQTPLSGEHCRVVQRGADWLIDRARRARGGDMVPDETTLLQRKLGRHVHSFLTAIALAELAGMVPDPEDHEAILEAIDGLASYIIRARHADGSWGTSYESSLTTATGWLALRSAHAAGRQVRDVSPTRTVEHLLRQFDRTTGGFRDPSRGGRVRFMSTATALRVLIGWGERDREEVRRGIEVLLQMRWDAEVSGMVGGEEYLGVLFGTQAMVHLGDERWTDWFAQVRDRMVEIQNADGSWTGHHCITSRVFCTACALWTLQVPKRLLVLHDQ